MALKDLFGKTTEKVVTKQQLQDLYNQAESQEYIEQVLEDKERYLPLVDFSSASNFAHYGSAEKYYVDAIKNIYQNYPYDGSKKEKQEWRNGSSQLDLYIFDEIYPKTTGYVSLSSSATLSNIGGYRSSSAPQYIKIKGGPNPSSTGNFETANLYDLDANRESNLGITSNGNTVEFWFKDDLTSSNANYNYAYALFDLWNGVTASSSDYTRLALTKISGSNKFAVTYRSGSAGITQETLNYTFDSSTWHHYAFSFANYNTNDLEVCLYIDGNQVLRSVYVASGSISLANNAYLVANVGALRASLISASTASANLGSSYGSYDEFRFWKSTRTSQQIYRSWNTQVGGGANTDEANKDLGVYLKFNEGVADDTNVNDLDKICLDYSGRVSNGTIINYVVSSKNTGSAIDTYFGVTQENKDPIVFSGNPLVQNILETYTDLGFQHDQNNTSNIYKTFPAWITEEAEKKGYQDLSQLIQIISSYFDTLYLQIESLPKIKNLDYDTQSGKPKPFAKSLLSSNGFQNLELFNDTTFLEDVLSRNDSAEFEEKLHNVKNAIYQNIYNNLSYIYKSKGTEKSLRNLIRCFGVDDDLVKINLYADNAQYNLENKYTYTTTTKKFVDFNNPDRNTGYIYQKAKTGDSNTYAFIPGSAADYLDHVPLTIQAEVIFPKNPIIDSDKYNVNNFETSSLYGIHTALGDPNNFSWGGDEFNFQVYSVRKFIGSEEAYFLVTGSFAGYPVQLSTSIFKDVYDNQKWNFAVRIKPENYPHNNLASGSGESNYTFEFVGINSIADSVDNSFSLTASVPNFNMTTALAKNKRVYAGAHYTDFDNTRLKHRTDVKISSVRFWFDYLSDTELEAHSYNAANVGRQYPNWPAAFIASLSGSLASSAPITKLDTLALHWNFFNVSSSDTNGQFIVEDASSGSLESVSQYGLDWFGSIAKYQFPGFADEFLASDSQVVNKEYVFSAKQQNPETLNGNDLVQILDTDDVTRTKDSKPIQYYISIEKSMAQVLNDEIMNWFATIKSYNNLIGDPLQRYKQEYAGLQHLRELFFSKVDNTISFEKFFEFYKWIDSSLSMMINQLVPASANSSDKVRNMVESHMLERSKYANKLPTVEFKGNPKSTPAISHLNYSYKEQAAYPNNLTDGVTVSRYYNFKPQWLKQRAIRNEAPVDTVLQPANDIDREILRQVINERNLDTVPKLYSVDTSSSYDGRRDETRIFTQTYRLLTDKLLVIEDIIEPVNIANNLFTSQFTFASASVTGSGQIVQPIKKKGNYSNPYEYVFIPGRTNNNKSFIDLEGNVSGSSSISALGFTDRTLPVRSVNKQVIVERFSSPGGPEVNSRGALDAAAEEYSVYNSLNYRNFRVRKVLNAWLAESASIDENYPSYHKVNKNPTYIPISETSSLTEPYYDNEFVVHAIPRSEAQYAWITASLFVKPSASGYISEYDNLNYDYEFLSASNLPSFTDIPFVNFRYFGDSATDAVLTDKIYDTATNTISGGQLFGAFTYIHTHFFLISLNGPYQYPSWKQIRNYENPFSIISRKNNNILVQDSPKQKTRYVNGKAETYLNTREETFTSFKEPPVTYNKPMTQKIVISGSNDPIEIATTYDNNKERFANIELAKRTGVGKRSEPQTHDILLSLERDKTYEPSPEIVEADYTAQIYPAKETVGLKETRSRPNYAEIAGTGSNGYDRNSGEIRSFWKDSIIDRRRTNAFYSSTKTGSLNNLNIAQLSGSSISSSYSGTIRHKSGSLYRVPAVRDFVVTTSVNKNYDSYYDSVFSLDNSSSYSYQSQITFYNPSSSFNSIYNIFSSSYGDLAGFDELEARQLLTYQDGEYYNQAITRSSDQTEIVQYFKYNVSGNIVRPRASYVNKIHYPSSFSRFLFITGALASSSINYTRTFINEGMLYKTNQLANKNPWYGSYEDYFADIKPLSQDKTLLPEYTFSEHADYFIKDNNGDFKAAPPNNYISFIGSDVSVNDYDGAYNITDKLNNFIFNDINNSDKTIKLSINGVKKLLPYKGFYPQERTAQIVDLFQKSFFNISMNDITGGYPTYKYYSGVYGKTLLDIYGCPVTQQMQTLLQPYFAPGILFNTIKSGIAVDWPTYISSSAYFVVTTGIGNGFLPAPGHGTSSFAVTSLTDKVPVLNKNFDLRIPFESLIDLRGFEESEETVLSYLDPTRYNTETFLDMTASNYSDYKYSGHGIRTNPIFSFNNKYSKNNQSRKFLDNRYSLAINNFLAETPRFFLQDQSLTSFTSNKDIANISFEVGKQYEMYVQIEKAQNVKMILDSLDDTPYIFSSSTIPYVVSPSPLVTGTLITSSAKFPAASLFGPPSQYFASSSGDESLLGHKAYDSPAYAPYAPPYYYGAQRAKLSFVPTSEVYTSYQEIINMLTVSCEQATTEMTDFFSSSINEISGVTAYLTGSTAYVNRMPLTSSIRYDILVGKNQVKYGLDGQVIDITDTNDVAAKLWRIQTKFETPILNFNTDLNKAVDPTNTTLNSANDNISYGGNTYYDTLNNLTTRFGFMGMWGGYAQTGSNSGVSLNIIKGRNEGDYRDLAETCGFNAETKYVGQIAAKKEISEAIVMIPFTRIKNHKEGKSDTNFDSTKARTIKEIIGENGKTSDVGTNGPYYFAVDRLAINTVLRQNGVNIDFDSNVSYRDLKNILSNIQTDNSIIKTMKAMSNYVLPPHLDWLYNRNINPFAMYVFEFKHELAGDELADIWQGVMPKSAMQTSLDTVEIEHALNDLEFFHGKKLPDDIQWKVFKVKRRANYSYDSLVTGVEERFNFKSRETEELVYSYNWPYDYFSLVELVNVEAKLTVKPTTVIVETTDGQQVELSKDSRQQTLTVQEARRQTETTKEESSISTLKNTKV